MALSGSKTVTLDSRGQVQLISEWSATQDKIAGTSTITVKNYLRFAYAIYATASQTGSTSIGGQNGQYNYSIGNHPNGVLKLIGTVTKTVPHNAVGDLTTTISTSNPVRVTYAGQYIGNADTSYSITLDKIARNSTLTALSDASLPSGSPSFTIAASNTSFTHIVDFKLNGKTMFSRTGLKGGNHNFNLTTAEKNAILKEMANIITSPFTVVLGTYSENTFIGVASYRNATLNIDENVKPNISNVEYYDSELYAPGNIFYNLSKLAVDTTATPGSFATMKSITVTYNGSTYNGANVITSVVTESYNATKIVVKATDSRNRTDTTTIEIPWVSYFPTPKIIWDAYRVNDGSSTPSDTGDRLYVNFQVNVGMYQGKGYSIAIQLDDGSWDTFYSGSNEFEWSDFQVRDIVLDLNKSYKLRFFAQTMTERKFDYIEIPTGFTTLDFRADARGVAVGKVSEKEAFEVNFLVELYKRLYVRAETANASDNGIIDMLRRDGSNIARFTYNESNNNLSLHRYAKNSTWLSSINFHDDGSVTGPKLITGVDSGSNANGRWVKYSDGTLIQKFAIAIPDGASVAWGAMFYKYINGTNWTFPIPFLSRQVVVTGSPEDYSGSIQTDGISATRATGVHLMRPTAFTKGTTVNLIAEGRWK